MPLLHPIKYRSRPIAMVVFQKPESASRALLLVFALSAALPSFAAPDVKTPVVPNGRERVDALGDPLPDYALFRIGTTRLQHHGEIQAVAASADGRFLASCGRDKVVAVWDAKDGKPIHKFALPSWGPWAVAFSHDGKELAAFSKFSPRSQSSFRRWDLATGRELTKNDDVPDTSQGYMYQVALGCREDGTYLAAENAEPNISLYIPRDPKSVKIIKADASRIKSLCFTHYAKTLVSLDDEGMIRLWSTEDGSEIVTVVAPRSEEHAIKGNNAFVAVSPDAKSVAITLSGGLTTVLDLKGRELRRLPSKQQMSALAYSPNGKTLITGCNVVEMWNAADAKPISLLKEPGHPIRTLALSPDGKLAACSDNGDYVRLVEVETGKVLCRREVYCPSISFTPNSERLAAASEDSIAFWDVAAFRSSEPLRTDPALLLRCGGKVGPFAFSPDGKLLAAVEDGHRACIYDTTSQKLLTTIRPSGGKFYSVAFSPDGKILATVGEQIVVRYGGKQPNVPQSVGLWDSFTGKELSTGVALRALAHTVVFHPSGKALAAIHLPVVAGQSPIGSAIDVRSVGLLDTTQAEDRMETIRTWDIGSKQETLRFEDPVLRKQSEGVTAWIIGRSQAVAAAFSPDGSMFATPGPGGIVLYETASGQPRIRLDGHLQEITGLAFTSDGNTLVSTSADSTLLIWDVTGNRTGKKHQESSEELWSLLANADAEKAGRAIFALVDSPADSLALLKKQLKPASVTPERLQELIANLDHPRFAVREQAGIDLAALGPAAEAALKKKLDAKPSLEAAGRIEKLLTGIRSLRPSQEQLRAIRAVEVLEHNGTPEAVAFLRELAAGAEGAFLTTHAKEAIGRADRRVAK
jgi:WD40 repeat protein